MAAESEAGAPAEVGLPQFDPSIVPSQLFWLAVVFVGLYLLLGRVMLPRIAAVIEARGKTIGSDLDAAAAANAKAQSALAAFEASLAAARAEARAKADAVRKDASDARAKAGAEADARLAERLAAAETRLAAERARGLEAARGIAADTAEAIVARLTGGEARAPARAKA